MTSLTENDQKNDINIDSKQHDLDNEQLSISNNDSTVITDNNQKQEESDENGQSNDLTSEIEKNNIVNENNNDNALINTSLSIVTNNEEQQQQQKEVAETTVNHDEDDNRSKKPYNSKVKYPSMPYYRSLYYTNDHTYGPAPYYYYPPPLPPPTSSMEKLTPLMYISTQQSSSSLSTSPSSRDNQTGNSTTNSSQNLPPRLRQTSTTENESNSQGSSTAPTTTQPPSLPPASATTTNSRRHRSILPRGSNSYYSTHPPPPLMATPPGVLYTYPPAVHQPGHIAYNIRPPDELELLAFQQQLMNMPSPPLLWPPPTTGLPPHGHPHFPPYTMNGPLQPAYIINPSTLTQPTNSFLNPEAAEWVPPQNDNDSSLDTNILINDEINFPPLNSTTNDTQTIINHKDHTEDNSEPTDSPTELISNDNPPISTDNPNISSQSNSKIDTTNNSSSSQDDTNNKISSPPPTTKTISYSTIISQTPNENHKSNKTNLNNHNQLPPRDRTTKQSHHQQQQQRIQNTSNANSRRRQPFNNNRNNTRNLLSTEIHTPQKPLQQTEITDEWIEVKSKKTKKFDRVINDTSLEKLIISDEQIHKSLSPPLSLTSTGDNTTTTTFTSEDDYDEKDNHDLVLIMNNNNVSNDYNQNIIDDIHTRLDNNEKLLIIMRGCPGSGKSTLAKSLNHGYNGVILSTDDYFIDRNLNKYVFDLNQLDDAHRYNRRRASDAFKQNISPIIIDNTNTQIWEMRPYVAMGKEANYNMILIEPQTPWRYKPRELFKRNSHNLPIRRIRDMLNCFEHNVTIQNIIDQLPLTTKSNNLISSEQITNISKDTEFNDSISISKKYYDIIDDSLILDDVRLCINDMILFITSNFYQTTRSTTSQSPTQLSVSFHDLSLISPSTSLPSTPSTPHSRFHRPLTRFSSTTNQDHSFNTEHILRLPSTFTRSFETNTLTPPLSAQSSITGKKRRKNKTKQQSNEILLNINNNNNNKNNSYEEKHFVQQTFNVFLPEDCSDFTIIDEHNDTNLNKDCLSTISSQPFNSIEHIAIQSSSLTKPFPTLSQLSLNILNQWNEEIQSTNTLINRKSLNDEIINSLEEFYGKLPKKSLDNNGIDDDLFMNILQKYLIKPVNNNQISLKQTTNCQISKKKYQFDYPIELNSSVPKTVLELRCNVRQHIKKCKEFCIKVHQANHYGMSGIASLYLQRAIEESQLLNDANRVACECLLRWKLAEFHQTQRLDLYGLHSNEALDLFKQIESEGISKSIEIITHQEKDSICGGNIDEIHSIILSYLQKQNYKYSEPNKGVILLQLTNAEHENL